jgi:hypothetical protein
MQWWPLLTGAKSHLRTLLFALSKMVVQVAQLDHVTDPDSVQLNELEGWEEVVTHLHPSYTYQDYSDVGKVLPICGLLVEEGITRTVQPVI